MLAAQSHFEESMESTSLKQTTVNLEILRKTIFKIERLLTVENYVRFLNFLDRYDDAWGKHMIDNIEDLALGNWDNVSKENYEKQAIRIIFERLDDFYKISGIDRNVEYLERMREF